MRAPTHKYCPFQPEKIAELNICYPFQFYSLHAEIIPKVSGRREIFLAVFGTDLAAIAVA